MIFKSEIQDTAVYVSRHAAFSAAYMIQRKARSPLINIVTVVDRYNGIEGWCIMCRDRITGQWSVVRKGLIAALCARHDVPAEIVEKPGRYGNMRRIDISNVPGMNRLPMLEEIPLEGPSDIHISWA